MVNDKLVKRSFSMNYRVFRILHQYFNLKLPIYPNFIACSYTWAGVSLLEILQRLLKFNISYNVKNLQNRQNAESR